MATQVKGLHRISCGRSPMNMAGRTSDRMSCLRMRRHLPTWIGSRGDFQAWPLFRFWIDQRRERNGLYAAMNGQPAFRLYPSSKLQWFAIDPDGFNPAPNVEISFQATPRARTSGLILRQDEADTTAPRLSASQAADIANALSARVKSQKQIPGSEKALRDYMDDIGQWPPRLCASGSGRLSHNTFDPRLSGG